MKTRIVNIYKEPCDVYIGREGKGESGYFGNPFSHLPKMESIKVFKEYFDFRIDTEPEFKDRVMELKGKRLGCFCNPNPCHGQVYVDYLEGEDESQLILEL